MQRTSPRVGVIGGGQLARMMQSAAIELGVELRLLSEADDASAALAIVDTVVGDMTDPATVLDFARDCDVITFDHEHVPPPILRDLEAAGIAVRPGPDALIHAQDKAIMRERLTGMGVPCPTWRIVDSVEDLAAFGDEIGWPIIAKVSRGGYDGKGVWKIVDAAGCAEPFAAMQPGAQVIGEEMVPFVRELSVLVARRPQGQAVAYPVSETVQTDGICTDTITPAPDLTDGQMRDLKAMAVSIAERLGVVGILAVELMQRPDGSVVVNELAMRPHNTGHWSQDGALTSQFENHLRAVLDLPLGSVGMRSPVVVMRNVLGGEVDGFDRLPWALGMAPEAKVHWYGKGHAPGRKLGHVNVCGDEVTRVGARARAVADVLRGVDPQGFDEHEQEERA